MLVRNKENDPIEQDQIIFDEGGDRAVTYKDSLGILTGGVGHRLTPAEAKLYPLDTAIPDEVRTRWFQEDMATAVADAKLLLPTDAPDAVVHIITNMAF